MLGRVLALGLVATLAVAWYLALPPPAQPQDAAPATASAGLRGVVHVHTRRSDGTGTVEEIAAAAARAGLDFVIFTDHGDGTGEPDPPQYRDGVLCLDAVEISTFDGHLLALGLPQTPYPLGGEARDVVADVARLGGLAIAAHPYSAKGELDWRDWSVPVDGLEWLNGDSQWRDESAWSLTRALFTYPARGIETLTGLLDRPDAALRQWDMLARSGKVITLAGTDAHARIGLRSVGEPYDDTISVHVPSYERMFRLFSNVLPGITLSGDPSADAQAILTAIRAGRLYSIVDALGSATLSFATSGATVRAEVPGAAEARIALLKDGVVVATAAGGALEHRPGADGSGAYRVEVSRSGAPGQPPIPWIVSNLLYVGEEPSAPKPDPPAAAATAFFARYTNGPANGWTIETSPDSRAALDVVPGTRGTELALRYAVGGAASASPFAAFALEAGPELSKYDRLVFTARADRPMRISVQLREPAGEAGFRWRRSVYLDSEAREVTLPFDDFRPVGATPRDRAAPANVDSILLVLDLVNTPLGGNGRIWIDDVRYAR